MKARTRLDLSALESEARKASTVKFWPAAMLLGAVSRGHAYHLAKSGQLPVIRSGRVLRLRSREILEALNNDKETA